MMNTTLVALSTVILLGSISSFGHGFAGKRFFPTTFMLDDPFISDEASILPGWSRDNEASEFEIDFGFAKRISKTFGFEIEDTFTHLDNLDATTANGVQNLGMGLKWQFHTNPEQEFLMSLGTDIEIGGTGTSAVGAELFTNITPLNFFFGKGFGNLPQEVNFLKPFALTGSCGFTFSTGAEDNVPNPLFFNWGFTLQYSLMYLQQFVKDIGLFTPFNRMVVVAEFPMTTQMDASAPGLTTGYFNPGLIWAGSGIQLGITARVPLNSQSGESVGVIGLIHFFIDDLFPNSLGRPIFQ